MKSYKSWIYFQTAVCRNHTETFVKINSYESRWMAGQGYFCFCCNLITCLMHIFVLHRALLNCKNHLAVEYKSRVQRQKRIHKTWHIARGISVSKSNPQCQSADSLDGCAPKLKVNSRAASSVGNKVISAVRKRMHSLPSVWFNCAACKLASSSRVCANGARVKLSASHHRKG